MKKLIENMTGGYSSSASVVDNNLIISLPNAKNPVVWRMDLSKVKTSSLEIRQEKDGSFVLTFKSEKGAQEDIAPFDSRVHAVKALMTISSAMQNADCHAPHTAANTSSPSHTHRNASGKNKWVGPVVGISILVLLIYVLLNMSPSRPLPADSTYNEPQSSFSGGAQPKGETGVPQSADAFLMGR